MPYDFDAVVSRKNSHCIKYDCAKMFGKPEDALPLWVADMDFQTTPAVTARLRELVDFAIYGYSTAGPDYFAAVRAWFRDHFAFEAEAEWLVKTPGVVQALATAVRALTREGEAVIIQQPVYGPFSKVVLNNGRRLVVSELKLESGRYRADLEDFERTIIESQARLFLLCSPHNPVGRVWTAEELRALGDICLKHGCLVVSDEIHCDFAHQGHRHLVFPAVSPDFAQNCVLCTAPSKTFNLAGLQASNIFIPNEGIRARFREELARAGCGEPNSLGLAACQAAYEHGWDWLKSLKEYLAGNLAYVREFLRAKALPITLIEPEGSYLAWLDFRELGRDPRDLNRFLAEEAKVWLNDGLDFGPSGAGFQRINLACPRPIVEEALGRLAGALK